MSSLDTLDLAVLSALFLATALYFTKGSLWGKSLEFDTNTNVASAGGAGTDSIAEKLSENDKNVIIFYGSQTGTAEDYASRFSKEASQRFGLKPMIADTEEYAFETLDQIPEDNVAVFFLATYGEGEPTDNAIAFYEFLSEEDVEFSNGGQTLENLNYVIFGLGNSTYEFYNAMGRNVDELLQKFGAHRIGPHGEGDDGAATMDEDYLSWKDEVFSSWKKEKHLNEKEGIYEPTLKINKLEVSAEEDDAVFVGEPTKRHLSLETVKGPYTHANPYIATFSNVKELFKSDHRNCIHAEIDLADSGLKYTTGDHVAIWPSNSNEEVDLFLTTVGLDKKRETVIDVEKLDSTATLSFPTPTTYEAVIRYFLEINGPVSRQFLLSVAAFAPNSDAKQKALKFGSDKDLFQTRITSKYLNIARALLYISNGIEWSDIPFSFLIEYVPSLQPRYYSISSSSKSEPKKVHITAVVESSTYPDVDHLVKGVATNLLLNIKQSYNAEKPRSTDLTFNLEGPRGKYNGYKLPIHIRRSTFKLPSNPGKPVILVGPGTGAAPFRGFIRDRVAQVEQGIPNIGKTLFFYGSRTSTEDFLYKNEWEEYKQTLGDSFNLITAFSRETDQKVYVQHKLLENSKLVNDLLLEGAYFYVCGDASKMARDVQAALSKIISTERNISEQKAGELLKQMKVQNLYQEDVW